MDWQQLLFSTSGRINRASYWLAVGVYFAVAVIAVLITGFVITGSTSDFSAIALYVGVGLVSLALFFSGIAVAIKRLHDRNKTGWWCIPLVVVPGLLTSASTGPVATGSSSIASGIAGLLGIWGLVELGILRGTSGPNRFGPDPLMRPEDDIT